jgi:hypothetical protein
VCFIIFIIFSINRIYPKPRWRSWQRLGISKAQLQKCFQFFSTEYIRFSISDFDSEIYLFTENLFILCDNYFELRPTFPIKGSRYLSNAKDYEFGMRKRWTRCGKGISRLTFQNHRGLSIPYFTQEYPWRRYFEPNLCQNWCNVRTIQLRNSSTIFE